MRKLSLNVLREPGKIGEIDLPSSIGGRDSPWGGKSDLEKIKGGRKSKNNKFLTAIPKMLNRPRLSNSFSKPSSAVPHKMDIRKGYATDLDFYAANEDGNLIINQQKDNIKVVPKFRRVSQA
jgi:hypothetical protein